MADVVDRRSEGELATELQTKHLPVSSIGTWRAPGTEQVPGGQRHPVRHGVGLRRLLDGAFEEARR